MSSAWKVAYADFVTALMAFFLLMWILNMVPPETKAGLASYFQETATLQTGASAALSNNAFINRTDKLDLRNTPLSEMEEVNLAIMQKLKKMLVADSVPNAASGLSADDIGVQLRINNDAMFAKGSAQLTREGQEIMHSVQSILNEYNVYLVVRGHADADESTGSVFASPWELSGARAAAAVSHLQQNGIKPTRMRAVAYGDTRPLEPGEKEANLARNRRVEFHFHRPEALTSSIVY